MPTKKRNVQQAEIVTAFAERLRSVRAACGMTQRELSEKAHITFSYISRLEAGGASPGIDLLEKLATALGVHVAELLPPPAVTGNVVEHRERVKKMFDEMLPKAGRDTLAMMETFLVRLAESPSLNR